MAADNCLADSGFTQNEHPRRHNDVSDTTASHPDEGDADGQLDWHSDGYNKGDRHFQFNWHYVVVRQFEIQFHMNTRKIMKTV